MAAYSISSRITNCPRFGEWKCQEWSRDQCNGLGMVQLWFISGGDDWTVGDDIEHQDVG